MLQSNKLLIEIFQLNILLCLLCYEPIETSSLERIGGNKK